MKFIKEDDINKLINDFGLGAAWFPTSVYISMNLKNNKNLPKNFRERELEIFNLRKNKFGWYVHGYIDKIDDEGKLTYCMLDDVDIKFCYKVMEKVKKRLKELQVMYKIKRIKDDFD
jgi:hypothetical protein